MDTHPMDTHPMESTIATVSAIANATADVVVAAAVATTAAVRKPMVADLYACVDWASNKPPRICKENKAIGSTVSQQKKVEQAKEKEFGNSMIWQINNGQWTTKVGEGTVWDVLWLLGENPRKPEPKGGFQPDIETDDAIIEVKTSSWWVSGTAGEKVLGTWIKYMNIPKLYGKPLKIVCLAYQEEELTNGKTRYFGDNVTKEMRKVLDMVNSLDIEYIPFTEFVLPALHLITPNYKS